MNKEKIMMNSQEIEFVRQCLQISSEIARRYFGAVTVDRKTSDPVQLLTEADTAISGFLVANITSAFPDHNIIDEETSTVDKGSTYTWVLDPLETSNFANGIPLYGILMGLLRAGQPIVGGMALPAFNEIYWAEMGMGAYCNEKRLSVPHPAYLVGSALLAFNFNPDPLNHIVTRRKTGFLATLSSRFNNTRSSNSCFDLAMVAQGRYAAAVVMDSKIWDNVAPQIILEEAGARYTGVRGDMLLYDDPMTKIDTNFAICAGDPVAHGVVLEEARYYF